MYKKLSPEVLALVKTEKKSRKAFRGELNKIKTQEIRKDRIKVELDKLAGLGARPKNEEPVETKMMTGTQPTHAMELEIHANCGSSSPERKKAKVTEESMGEC